MLSLARKSADGEPPAENSVVGGRIFPGDGGDSATAKLLRLVGEGKRVLVLGSAKAPLHRELDAQGCDVVGLPEAPAGSAKASAPGDSAGVNEHGELVIPEQADANDFDVVAAVGALEHQRDPLALLQAVRKCLRRDGYLVAVVPNVAHGSVRLALLDGWFPFGEEGALKEVPLRFFTYNSMIQLFEQAEFAVAVVERHEEDVRVPDGATDRLEFITGGPEARTTHFLTVAYPLPAHGLGWLQSRLHDLVEQHAAARLEAEELRQDLEAVNQHVGALVEQQEASLRREKQWCAQAMACHQQLLQRDEDLRVECAKRHALETRLEQIRRSLPGRLYKLARKALTLGRKSTPK